MFNLYADAIDPNGFMGLVSKNINANDPGTEVESRKIIASFTIVSVLVLSIIATDTISQQFTKASTAASYTSAV